MAVAAVAAADRIDDVLGFEEEDKTENKEEQVMFWI